MLDTTKARQLAGKARQDYRADYEDASKHIEDLCLMLEEACNEIIKLRQESWGYWLGLCLVKNHGSDNPKVLKEVAAGFIKQDDFHR